MSGRSQRVYFYPSSQLINTFVFEEHNVKKGGCNILQSVVTAVVVSKTVVGRFVGIKTGKPAFVKCLLQQRNRYRHTITRTHGHGVLTYFLFQVFAFLHLHN